MERAHNGTSGTKEPVLQPVQFVSIKGIPLLYEIKQEPLDEAECEEQQMLAAHSPSAVWLPVKTEALCGDPLGQETLPSDWSRGEQVPDLHQSHESVNLLNQVSANFGVCKREPADALEAVQGPVWEQAGRCVAEDPICDGSSCGTALPSESRESLAPGPQTRAGWQRSTSAASRGDTRRGQGTSGTSAALPVSNSQSETLELTDNHNSLPSNVIFKCNECSKTFTKKCSLNNHLKRLHTNTLPDLNLKKTSLRSVKSFIPSFSKSQQKKIKALKTKIKIFNVKEDAKESKELYTKKNAVTYKCHKCFTHIITGKIIKKHYSDNHKYISNLSKAIICSTVIYTCKICKKKLFHCKSMQDHILKIHADAYDTELTSQNMTNAVPTFTESADLNTQTVIASSSSQNLSPGLESVIEISNPIKTEPCDSNSTDESILANASGVMNSNQLKSEPLSSSDIVSVTDASMGLIETKIEISDTTLESESEVEPEIPIANFKTKKCCPNCPYASSSYKLYKKHVELNMCKDFIFKCCHCKVTFTCDQLFVIHCKSAHKYCYCFKCKICCVRFRSYSYLANHIVRYHHRKVIFCRHCLVDIPYKTYVPSHRRRCVYRNKCTLCKFIHAINSDLKKRIHHLSDHIKDKEFKFHCSQCLNYFCTKFNLDCHISMKHDLKLQCKCFYCDKICYSKPMMRKHLKRSHYSIINKTSTEELKTLNTINLITCTFCKIIVANTKELMQHVRTVHMAGFMQDSIFNF